MLYNELQSRLENISKTASKNKKDGQADYRLPTDDEWTIMQLLNSNKDHLNLTLNQKMINEDSYLAMSFLADPITFARYMVKPAWYSLTAIKDKIQVTSVCENENNKPYVIEESLIVYEVV